MLRPPETSLEQGPLRKPARRGVMRRVIRSLTTAVKDPATGKWSQTPNFNSNGYIIYADTGHMGVHIQPKVRPRFAANSPTAQEAQAALRGYTAYFGSFTVSDKEKEKFVVHHRFGQINPGGEMDAKRFYDFVTTPNNSQRLIL